jgi:DNA-binding XRE family transcriptional regulator
MDLRSIRTDIPALPFCNVSLKAAKPLPPAYPKVLYTLGDHIRKKRLDLKLQQKEVADIIGVEEATIYNWENNRSSPAIRYLPKIREFLGSILNTGQPQSPGERIVNAANFKE